MHKLSRAHKPTTAPIGTQRLMASLVTLARQHNVELQVRKLLARTRAEILVASADSNEVVKSQWAELTRRLQKPDTALIYHLENHYSVIYAIREWNMMGNVTDGVQAETRVRQILVGKPGQAPNRWIDWEDVRACLLGWKGYGIVSVQRETVVSTCVEDCSTKGVPSRSVGAY